MIRFFVSTQDIQGDIITLTEENLNHAKVLRLKVNEQVLVCDGDGLECLCKVSQIFDDEIILTVSERRSSVSEAKIKASVYIAFPKSDKLEHIIQKATELGAYEIVAFPAARCITKIDAKSSVKKLQRWQKIAHSAAEQSGRGVIPKVRLLSSYAEALKDASKSDLAILFYENEKATTLSMALKEKDFTSISILTGSEGGFEESEVAKAINEGFKICTLGNRILRCETAPLCALSAIMYEAGEF